MGSFLVLIDTVDSLNRAHPWDRLQACPIGSVPYWERALFEASVDQYNAGCALFKESSINFAKSLFNHPTIREITG